ncbi:hypothetical protein Tco_0398124 [Tanacetum coccineum]
MPVYRTTDVYHVGFRMLQVNEARDSVMSSASAVTYTSVYTDSEPGRVFWGADEELSDGGYVVDSDPEEGPKEDHVDYPADGGDDDDDEPSNDDDDDDDTDDEDEEPFEDEDDDEEEEEHLALADSVVAPVVDHVPSSEETEPISIRPEAPMPFPSEEEVKRLLALPPPPPSPLISLSPPSTEERLARYLVAPALPSSPLPIVPHPYGSPNHVHAPLGFRAAMGRLRASSPSTHHPLHPSPPLPPPPSSLHLPPYVPTSLPLPSSPLPPLPSSLFIPPPVDYREDIPKAELPPCKRLCLTDLTLRYEVGESSTAALRPIGGHRADYGFIGTMDAEIRKAVEEVAPTTLEGVNARVTDLATVQEKDTQDIYVVIEDTQDRQTQLFQRVDGLVSSLQGQLLVALGQIQALQARDQTHADDREGVASTALGLVFSFLVSDNHNNMPPRRSSATARAAAATAAATLMTADAVEQLIKARVSHLLIMKLFEIALMGTEGVVVLSQWFEKMESVFHISNCAVENQVKFATCTFLKNALTWWNSHMKTVTQDVSYAMD